MKKAILALMVVVLMVMAGCKTEQPKNTIIPIPQQGERLVGVSLSPRSFSSSDFKEFLSDAQKAGNAMLWAGDWNELNNPRSAPYVVASMYGANAIIEVTPFTQSKGKVLRSISENEVQYVSSIAKFAETYKPKYIGIGIETNYYGLKSPNGYKEFVSLYNKAYDAVKAASPNTKVFTAFQLEAMKGLWESPSEQWSMLDDFKLDIAVFTTYPYLVYDNPVDIPSDYYSSIKQHTSLPIGFTEMGWPSESMPGRDSSEEEQALFVDKFGELAGSPEIKIWSFLYDQKTIAPFDTMGLKGRNGVEKKAWARWSG
ncbi:hypothetical protein HY638_03995 [Candidatus Woesearchaeota archaeon]|nr:hypothetical protein [Candidatus Woesearchaeota archaeon]